MPLKKNQRLAQSIVSFGCRYSYIEITDSVQKFFSVYCSCVISGILYGKKDSHSYSNNAMLIYILSRSSMRIQYYTNHVRSTHVLHTDT